jgi:tRNA nucleotidyltransferase (CCA-adding enzyme)
VARLLEDPLDGAGDLQRRLVRAVGDPLQRFTEDGLRTMRAVRFAAVLEFELEEATRLAIPLAVERFRLVSMERVRDELLKLLCAPRPSVGIELMHGTGLLAEVLPEVLAGDGVAQNRYHPEDVYRHTLQVCDGVPPDPLLRLAALLHDVGKPPAARPHPERAGENTFHGHEALGAELCDAIARRLKLANDQRQRLCHLVGQHMFEVTGWSAAGLRRFLRRVGREHLDDLFALRTADLRVKEQAEERLPQLDELRRRLDAIAAERPPLRAEELAVDGHALMEHLGIGPGRRVGEILRALLERVIDDPSLNERERLLALASALQRSGY